MLLCVITKNYYTTIDFYKQQILDHECLCSMTIFTFYGTLHNYN